MSRLTTTVKPTNDEIVVVNSYFQDMTSPGIEGTNVTNAHIANVQFVDFTLGLGPRSPLKIELQQSGTANFHMVSFHRILCSSKDVYISPTITCTCLKDHAAISGSHNSAYNVQGNWHNMYLVGAHIDFQDSNCSCCTEQGGSGITFTAGNGQTAVVQRMILLKTESTEKTYTSCVVYAGNREFSTADNTLKCCLFLYNTAVYLAGAQDAPLVVEQCISRGNSNAAAFLYRKGTLSVLDCVIHEIEFTITGTDYGWTPFASNNRLNAGAMLMNSQLAVCDINLRFTDCGFSRERKSVYLRSHLLLVFSICA